MEFLENYLVIVVMGICLCVGYIIKNLIPSKGVNKFIPLIMGGLGVFINVWANGFSASPEIILAGLISGLASTGMHQAFKEFINKKEDK